MEQLDIFSLLTPEKATAHMDRPTKKVVIPTNNAKVQPKETIKNGLWSDISEQLINDMLLLGSGFQNGKKRIYEFFSKEKDEAKRAEMLKKEYGIGGSGLHWGYWLSYDSKGLTIRSSVCEKQVILSWRNVAERIGKLIHYHLYYA